MKEKLQVLNLADIKGGKRESQLFISFIALKREEKKLFYDKTGNIISQ